MLININWILFFVKAAVKLAALCDFAAHCRSSRRPVSLVRQTKNPLISINET